MFSQAGVILSTGGDGIEGVVVYRWCGLGVV